MLGKHSVTLINCSTFVQSFSYLQFDWSLVNCARKSAISSGNNNNYWRYYGFQGCFSTDFDTSNNKANDTQKTTILTYSY